MLVPSFRPRRGWFVASYMVTWFPPKVEKSVPCPQTLTQLSETFPPPPPHFSLSLSLSRSLCLSFFLGGMGASPRAFSPAPVFGGPRVGLVGGELFLSLSLSLSLFFFYPAKRPPPEGEPRPPWPAALSLGERWVTIH